LKRDHSSVTNWSSKKRVDDGLRSAFPRKYTIARNLACGFRRHRGESNSQPSLRLNDPSAASRASSCVRVSEICTVNLYIRTASGKVIHGDTDDIYQGARKPCQALRPGN